MTNRPDSCKRVGSFYVEEDAPSDGEAQPKVDSGDKVKAGGMEVQHEIEWSTVTAMAAALCDGDLEVARPDSRNSVEASATQPQQAQPQQAQSQQSWAIPAVACMVTRERPRMKEAAEAILETQGVASVSMLFERAA